MSKLETNTIDTVSGSTTLTLGGTNATTIAQDSATTVTGFKSTGIDDNATSTAITIDSSERVGIGETNPDDALLVIKGDSDENTTPSIRLKDGTDAREAFVTNQSGDLIIATTNSSDDVIDSSINIQTDNILMKTANTTRISINSNGTTKIAGNGAAVDAGDYHQIVGNGSNFYELKILNKNSSPASQYITEVSFASAAPDNGAAKFFQMRDSSTARVNINSDGDIYNHDGTYGTISDERIKQNIVDAGSQWEDIKNIRVRKYKKKDDVIQYGEENAPLEIGVISQELETVSPGLIKEDKADSSHAILHEDFTGDNPQNVKYVKYSILYMKAIKALQEAMERIETLETQRAELEARITALENA